MDSSAGQLVLACYRVGEMTHGLMIWNQRSFLQVGCEMTYQTNSSGLLLDLCGYH